MYMYRTQYPSAAALSRVADAMQAGALRLRAAAKWLDAWLEKRRAATTSLHDLERMSERELLDIGLTRGNLDRTAWLHRIEIQIRI